MDIKDNASDKNVKKRKTRSITSRFTSRSRSRSLKQLNNEANLRESFQQQDTFMFTEVPEKKFIVKSKTKKNEKSKVVLEEYV